MSAKLAAFIAGLGAPDVGPADDMIAALEKAHAAAAQVWPTLAVPEDAFMHQLGRCLAGEGPDYAAALAELELGDVYLCCACLLGLEPALMQLEQIHLSSVSAFIARVDRSPDFVDEVTQTVRQKLLLSENGEPRLARYLGRGPLHSWIAVVAQRTALDLLRTQKRNVPMAELESHLSNSSDPDLALVKARLRSHFEQALRAALGHLNAREQTILRLTVIAGFSLEQVGAMYQVNASTVSRWLKKARETLLIEMQRLLREGPNLDPADLQSIVRLVGSQVDVSLSHLLPNDPLQR
jgi:RNA polymerase sigma-70 factor (ECF subfamily)